MEVYIEYAFAENACMDFFLLYAAKAAAKNRAGVGRIAIASAAGACFAVLFPLFNLSGWAAVGVKVLSGAAICLVAGRYSGVRPYLKFTALFTAFTFALGGGLIALFWLAGVSYTYGGGAIISSVPAGIPLAVGLVLVIIVKKVAKKFIAKNSKTAVICRIYVGQSHITLPAFFDSGNAVYLHGAPVSVLPKSCAGTLCNLACIKTFVTVHTVAGGKKLPVITADKVEIDYGEKVISLRGVHFCAAPVSRRAAVLHPDLAEAD